MKDQTVAFIGAGNMGSPMARRVKKAGFDLIVCDREQSVLSSFADEGTRTTEKASECAGEDVIILLLANEAQILDAVFGSNGLSNSIPEGHCPLICVMSTVLPVTIEKLVKGLAYTEARILDIPISGGIVGAQQGSLTIMSGGDEKDVEEVMPVLNTLGRHTFYCGSLGSAQVVKIINNMIGITNMLITAEAVELAQAYDVSFEKISPILSVSSGLNFLTIDANKGRRQYLEWARSDSAYNSTRSIISKDLHLAFALSESASVDLDTLRILTNYLDSNDENTRQIWKKIGKPVNLS